MLLSPRRQLEAVVRHEGRHLARCLVGRGRYVIGQDPKSEIRLDEASISGRHARLTVVSEGEIYIEDFGSSNGTFVNSEPTSGLTRIALDSQIELGQCTLQFQRSGLPAGVYPHLPDGFLRSPRYNFGEVIVQGSTSTIFEAHDTSLDRDVALKVMLPGSQASEAAVLRFVREAQITSQLQHPNIPPVYELSLDEQSELFYTTRFVEGDSLARILDRLRENEPATIERWTLGGLLAVFQKVCDAIAFAHSRGVVHSSLQPEGIMVGRFGEVFVLGWGFAKVQPALDAETDSFVRRVNAPEATTTAGLTPFLSPEQAADTPDKIDARTDLYSLGAILYRLLTLQDPFAATDEAELVAAIVVGAHTPPATHARTPAPHWPAQRYPDYLAAVATRALSLAREDRHPTVAHLQREIATWQDGLASGADLGKLWRGVCGTFRRH